MIVLDTNILSELMRPGPDPAVLDWLRARPATRFATTTINIAEIRYGLARLADGRRRADLETRFASFLARGLGNRIFDFDGPAANAYGELMVGRERRGRRLEGFDGLIAAIVRSRDAAIATRNLADFEDCGFPVVNPWNTASA